MIAKWLKFCYLNFCYSVTVTQCDHICDCIPAVPNPHTTHHHFWGDFVPAVTWIDCDCNIDWFSSYPCFNQIIGTKAFLQKLLTINTWFLLFKFKDSIEVILTISLKALTKRVKQMSNMNSMSWELRCFSWTWFHFFRYYRIKFLLC